MKELENLKRKKNLILVKKSLDTTGNHKTEGSGNFKVFPCLRKNVTSIRKEFEKLIKRDLSIETILLVVNSHRLIDKLIISKENYLKNNLDFITGNKSFEREKNINKDLITNNHLEKSVLENDK